MKCGHINEWMHLPEDKEAASDILHGPGWRKALVAYWRDLDRTQGLPPGTNQRDRVRQAREMKGIEA